MSNKVSRVTFCKVCKDAGEPDCIYTSHNVKNRDGIVTCPKLKSIVCFQCGKRGHTSSYCKTRSNKKTESVVEKRPNQVEQKNGAKGKFDCLFEDESDDETIDEPNISETIVTNKHINEQSYDSYSHNYPSLTYNNAKNENYKSKNDETKLLSYANMAAKPVEPKLVREIVSVPAMHKKHSITEQVRVYQKASEMDWAIEDSDDDSDEDY